MAGDTVITLIGNLTSDPELRFTPSGAAVASFTIASTPRTFNRQTNAWEDGSTLFMRCSIWRNAAENVAETLRKGTRVIATGRLTQRTYTTRDGQDRTVVELQVDEIGPSLRYATAQVARNTHSGGQASQSGGQTGGNHASSYTSGPQTQQPTNQPAPAPADDPWGIGQGADTSFGDEPPF